VIYITCIDVGNRWISVGIRYQSLGRRGCSPVVNALGICVGAAFAEDDLQLLPPVLAQGDEFPIDFG
jgi:hypothetical protein